MIGFLELPFCSCFATALFDQLQDAHQRVRQCPGYEPRHLRMTVRGDLGIRTPSQSATKPVMALRAPVRILKGAVFIQLWI